MNYFDEYTHNYDLTEPKLEYKYYHSFRVMANMVLLAKNINLPTKDIELARYIGLLHDIGRFEQYARYQSFSDFNLDHGDYGSNLLRKDSALKYYNIDKSDYEVVYKSIKNHNKFKVETNLTNRELLFTKMIRDADKLDILYALSTPEIKGILNEDDSTISPEIDKSFFNEELIRNTKNSTKNEQMIMVFGFVYDINFNCILDIIKTENYYKKIYDRLEHKELFAPYYKKVKEYLKERTD